MTRVVTFQDFFNNNPAIAGILVFVVIALMVIIVWLIIFFGSKSIKKRRLKEKKVSIRKQPIESKDINNIVPKPSLTKEEKLVIQEKEIESNEKEQYVFDEHLIYFIVDFNKDGKLVLKNMTKKIINDKPTKKDYYDSMLISSSKLLLPEKYIELRINQKELETSKPIEGRNLYIYNSLKRFLNENETPWATPKFD